VDDNISAHFFHINQGTCGGAGFLVRACGIFFAFL